MSVLSRIFLVELLLTDSASHDGCETCSLWAVCWILEQTEVMFEGAGTVFGRAAGALINALRPLESFDMVLGG